MYIWICFVTFFFISYFICFRFHSRSIEISSPKRHVLSLKTSPHHTQYVFRVLKIAEESPRTSQNQMNSLEIYSQWTQSKSFVAGVDSATGVRVSGLCLNLLAERGRLRVSLVVSRSVCCVVKFASARIASQNTGALELGRFKPIKPRIRAMFI